MAEHDFLIDSLGSFLCALQDEICCALEELDGVARFGRDDWKRAGGGGGTTRVLEGGALLERAGVAFSHVHGDLGEEAARRLPGRGTRFAAVGLSLVLHPLSPMIPTVHANFRLVARGSQAGFGGGADLTPHYLFDEDARHFHETLKEACDRHDRSYYPRFKETCDRYFWLPHRGEARGVGGIFFEDLAGDGALSFVEDCARAFLPAWRPIAARRRATPYGEAQRLWQELRRGRYVEFNLLRDRGTAFGLDTGGRTESILMSMPPRARWVYDHQPAPGTEEARLVEVLRAPRAWV
jgi:coproporphyrinogen III oxidase